MTSTWKHKSAQVQLKLHLNWTKWAFPGLEFPYESFAHLWIATASSQEAETMKALKRTVILKPPPAPQFCNVKGYILHEI